MKILQHLRKRALLVGAVLAFSVPSGGVAEARGLVIGSLDEPVSLAGDWKFRFGDDPAWARPGYDDSRWESLAVPGGWGRQGHRGRTGLAWYRLEIDLREALADVAREGAEAPPDPRIGLRMGKVTSSYEVFAGGRRIGGVGALPPRPRMEYDRHRVYPIPAASIPSDGRLVLALRVWKSDWSRAHEGGPGKGTFAIGPLDQLREQELLSEIPYLVFVLVFGVVGVFHLRLFADHRSLRENLWFGLFALDVAAYGFLCTQWKYALSDDFALLKNLEYTAIYALPALGIEFVWSLYARPIGRWLRAYQLSHVALAAVVGLSPGLELNLMTISLWQVWTLPTIVLAAAIEFQEHRRGRSEVKPLALSIFLAACVFDIAVDRGWIQSPRLMPLGMSVMIFSMAVSLAHRVVDARRELEKLAGKLGRRVAKQTAQLRAHTAQLERKNRELAHAHRSLREASLTDPLTGLRNRRFLVEYLEHDVARVLRDHARATRSAGAAGPTPMDLVFLLMDVDHFKAVNDYHGHNAGDCVLEQMSVVLREVCRESDFLVRWGGEEFLIVSRFVDRDRAPGLAERIRREVHRHPFDGGDGVGLHLTCSIGFASFPFLVEDPEALGWEQVVAAADCALYTAKMSGRDAWVGVCGGDAAAGVDDLARCIREDFSGALSRGEIRCQASKPIDAPDPLDDPEKTGS